MKRKLRMLKLRGELTLYAKQQILEKQNQEADRELRASRHHASRLESRVTRRLTRVEFDEITLKLVENLGSRSQLYDLAEQVMHDDPEHAEARHTLMAILGSPAQLRQYIMSFKQPESMIAYLSDRLGGIQHAFKFIDRALTADFWSIYKISKTIGHDTKATIRFLRSLEKTVAAAAACLSTKPCHFHHVVHFLELLMKREWSESDLVEVANGRYLEYLKPGQKPNKNPLLTTATKMSEEDFLQFFANLKSCNYKYFLELGNIQYEQTSDKRILR